MNRLQYAFLAGSALVALTATGCASSSSKPAAQQPAASGSPAGATTPSVTSSASGSAASGTSSSAVSSSSAKTSGSSSSGKTSSKPSGVTNPADLPDCANAKLNAALAPRVAGQKASVYVIAVKNTGPDCQLQYLPYVWITAGPGGGPEQTRPLIPSGLGGPPNPLRAGTTQYAAIDLNPGDAANAVDGYTYLSVTANPTRDTSGKDVQDLKLPAPAKVAKAKLGLYTADVATAIEQMKFADTPEQ